MDVGKKKCEGCGLKQPNFGLPAEGKKRWCAGCAKGHVRAVDVVKKKKNVIYIQKSVSHWAKLLLSKVTVCLNMEVWLNNF